MAERAPVLIARVLATKKGQFEKNEHKRTKISLLCSVSVHHRKIQYLHMLLCLGFKYANDRLNVIIMTEFSWRSFCISIIILFSRHISH